ncbi:MAG: hypothetical protein M3N54_11940 [Acidobacteriota bacterium]|nr:hypothetical protein [Acidobacteriota bacterium]
MKDIIKRLEQQKTAIDRALSALKAMDGTIEDTSSSVSSAPAPAKRGRRKGGMTPEGRRRLSEALKARWAAKRTPEASGQTATKRGRKKK